MAFALRDVAASRYAVQSADKKPDHYYAFYERLIAFRRHADFALLELGVKDGFSLLMWRDFFPNARIVGVDIRQRPPGLPQRDTRLNFVQGSQADPLILNKATQLAGGSFDVIIDDAAHTGALAKASFVNLFGPALNRGGLYFFEDYATAYREGWPDGKPLAHPDFSDFAPMMVDFPSHSAGMAGLLKQIIDQMNANKRGSNYLSDIDELVIQPDIACVRKKR